jgi:biopolymer transport protein TolR
MSEINVTPFVDVMLVLLIIFMVAAPMLTVGVPIELPKSAAQPLATEQEEPLTIALSSEGKIVLQNIEIKNENLIEKLVAVAEERTNNKVFLRADASVNYAAVMEVMGALNAAGFNNIGLVTDAGGPKLDGSDP